MWLFQVLPLVMVGWWANSHQVSILLQQHSSTKRSSVTGIADMNGEDLFLRGIGLSVYQNSGDTNSNWTKFIQESGRVKDAKQITKASDFWNWWDNTLLNKLGPIRSADVFKMVVLSVDQFFLSFINLEIGLHGELMSCWEMQVEVQCL